MNKNVFNLEDTVGLSIFVLVSPNHGVHFDDTEDTILGNYFFFIHVTRVLHVFGTERCFQLRWVITIFHGCLRSFVCRTWLILEVVLKISVVLHLT